MNRTHAKFAAVLLAAGAAVLTAVAPASAATSSSAHHGRYPYPTCDGGAVSADRVWAEHVVGCGGELTAAQVRTIIELRDQGTEGLTAGVPARQIVAHFAEVLGNRTDAVTLWTATAVYAYGG